MRHKILSPLLIFLIVIFIGSAGLSIATAEPALQPFRPTSTPQQQATATPEVQSELATVAPAATQEIALDALILEDGWQFPTNLSRSGGTSASQIVYDSSGNTHAFWSDEIEGFGYSVRTGEVWSKPVAAEYPFFTRRYFPDLQSKQETPIFRPVLAAGGQGQIWAFWIDEGVLYASSVPAGSFTDYDSWAPRFALSNSALVVTTARGTDGSLHLLYIRPEESSTRPAGVYYQKISASGSLNDPILLYASRYLRTIPVEEANLQAAAPDGGSVYAVWDDPLKQQLFFASSSDGGSTWNSPQEIDRRGLDDAENSAGPARIAIGAHADQLHLSWGAGHELTGECSQYTSMSSDGGEIWTTREPLAGIPLCFSSTQFVNAGDTLLLLGTTTEEGADRNSLISTTYLFAWNGNRWSAPQIQEALSNFTNPETNQDVRLLCQSATGQGNNIELLGCDSAEGRDTWLLSREVGDITSWFPPPPIWQGPDEIDSVGSQPLAVQLVSSRDGIIHALWNVDNSPRIYLAGWENEVWGSSQEIVVSPGGSAASLSAASAGDRLYLAWEDPARGLQFSRASISDPSQWSDPTSFPGVQPAASSPSIIADEGGNVFLAYVMQLNEERGVFLIHSADAGESWSPPLKVFDGSAAGWDMVDRPVLTRTENGQMHLMWTRRTLPPDGIPLGLAYSRSEDLGQSWSEAELFAEAETSWNELVGAGERFVHRLWSEEDAEQVVVWHNHSLDGGLSWSPSEQVIGTSGESVLAMAVDPAQRPHLLILENEQLRDLIWDGEIWTDSDGLETALAAAGNMAAVANHEGKMMVAYAGNLAGEDSEEIESRLFAMWRNFDLPAELVAPLPTLTPTPPPTAAPPATATPEPTATVFFSTQQERSGLGEIPGMSGLPFDLNLLAAFIPVLIILGLGILIGVRLIRRR